MKRKSINKSNEPNEALPLLLIGISIIPVIGMIMIHMSINRNPNIQVQEAIVIETNNQSIKVQSGWEQGDPVIYELKRITFFHPKKGDKIYIKYNRKSPKKVRYTINPSHLLKIGEVLMYAPFILLGIGIVLFKIVMRLLIIIDIFSNSIKKKK